MSDTKNIKGNRKAVFAEYTIARWFKIPDGLDLEDETVVKYWEVEYGDLHIIYTDGTKEIIESEDDDFKFKNGNELHIETSIEDASDGDIYYTADEESDED